jgi:hypothetical protein
MLGLSAPHFPDDRCSLCREIIHTTSGLTTLEHHDIKTAVGSPDKPPRRSYFSQIQAHTIPTERPPLVDEI